MFRGNQLTAEYRTHQCVLIVFFLKKKLDMLDFQDGANWLSRNVGNELPLYGFKAKIYRVNCNGHFINKNRQSQDAQQSVLRV